MRRTCQHCGLPLPDLDLADCPHCGQALKRPSEAPLPRAGGLPVLGGETAEELAQRFLTPPVVYGLPGWLFCLQLVAPLLLPFGVAALSPRDEPDGLVWVVVTSVVAGLVVAGLLLFGRPDRISLIVDRRGLRRGRRRWEWDQVTAARLVGGGGKRLEPDALEVLGAAGVLVRIRREQTRTASIRSLRNLAELIELLVAARAKTGQAGNPG